MPRRVEIPNELDDSIIIYECEIKRGSWSGYSLKPPLGFEGVLLEGDNLKILCSDEVLKNPDRIWIVKKNPVSVAWGLGDISYELDNQKKEFGVNGELRFYVRYADGFVREFPQNALFAKDIRRHLKTEIKDIMYSILTTYAKRHGVENFDKSIFQQIQNSADTQLKDLFTNHYLSLDSFTITGHIDYSKL